jgi:hypothetical protein
MRSPSSFWKLPGNHDIGSPDAARAEIPSLIAAGKANGEIAEALIRETARRDRPLGSAKRDFETIHIGKKYDIELHPKPVLRLTWKPCSARGEVVVGLQVSSI